MLRDTDGADRSQPCRRSTTAAGAWSAGGARPSCCSGWVCSGGAGGVVRGGASCTKRIRGWSQSPGRQGAGSQGCTIPQAATTRELEKGSEGTTTDSAATDCDCCVYFGFTSWLVVIRSNGFFSPRDRFPFFQRTWKSSSTSPPRSVAARRSYFFLPLSGSIQYKRRLLTRQIARRHPRHTRRQRTIPTPITNKHMSPPPGMGGGHRGIHCMPEHIGSARGRSRPTGRERARVVGRRRTGRKHARGAGGGAPPESTRTRQNATQQEGARERR